MKPHLSFWQILNMNVGFFGIQFSFGLQQANMSPIYAYLGADEGNLPLLWLAGPMTGLLVQPIIGAMSDRTVSRWGRRTPYFLIGAILCSLGLLVMPFSPTLWFAAGLLWILDAANNVTMEPYRAYVSDRLNKDQHSLGFLSQSAFTGLAQTMAYLAPSILVFLGMNKDAVNANNIPHITVAAFLIGALLSFITVYWSVKTVPELPMSEAEKNALRAKPSGVAATLERHRRRVQGNAADDAPALVDEAVPVVRDDVLLDLHRAGAGAHDVQHERPDDGRLSRRGAVERPDRRLLQLRRLRRRVRDGAVHQASRRQAGACAVPDAGRHRHVGDSVDPRQGVAVRADDRRRPGLGLDHGQSVRAAGRQHPARARRRVHGHLQHVHRHPDADPDGHAAAVLQQPARRRPVQRHPPGRHAADHRRGVRVVRESGSGGPER